MNKRNLTIILLSIVSIGIIFFIIGDLWISATRIKNHPSIKKDFKKINVATSFYPVYFFTQQIAGNKAEVSNITPEKSNPQSYKLTTQNVKTLGECDLIILNGLDFELWKNDAIEINKSICLASSNLSENQVIEITETKMNPYIWISPVLAKQMTDKILEGFLEKDVKNKNYYQINTEKLKTELDNLDAEYKNKLVSCQSKNFIVLDFSFSYLAKQYNLNQILLSGLSINENPTEQQIKNIKDFIKEQNIKYIFAENSLNFQWQKNIEEKLEIKIILLDTIDKDLSKENYFSRMRKNLENLKTGLECQ